MPKKLLIFLALIVFFTHYQLALADVVINEIMYDVDGTDTGREWIEVYNNADTSVDLSTYKLFEANTNHALSVAQGDATLPAHSYALLVSDINKFKIDWPDFAGSIFDSSFSLSNDGEALAIKDASLNVVDQYTYSSASGATGDGNSLQKMSGSWTAATPTLGATNETTTVPSGNSSGSVGSTSNTTTGNTSSLTSNIQTQSKTPTPEPKEQKIKTKIVAGTLAFTSIPLVFQAYATGTTGVQLHFGKYFFNFGDGDSKEIKVNGLSSMDKFTHTYFYPGDYVVNLEYFVNPYGDVPDAFDKITVKVVPLSVAISSVGGSEDFFVELSNNMNYDIDISNWILASAEKSFVMPRDTVLTSKNKIIFSPKVTGLDISDKNTLKLMTPQGVVAFAYDSEPSPIVNEVVPVSTNEKINSRSVDSSDQSSIIPAEALSATASKSDTRAQNTQNTQSSGSPLVPVLSILFIGGSAGAVYFIRQKRVVPSLGNDFEILDE